MTTMQNGLTAGNSQPAKNIFKQGHHFTVNQHKNAQIRHQHSATMRWSAKHTKEVAVAAIADKMAFSRPEFMVLGLGVVEPQGHQHGYFHVFTPSPIRLSKQQANGCKSQVGAFQMAPANSTPTPTQGTTPHDHITLTQHATERLALALFELRNGKSTTSLQRATGLVYSAARSLSQVCGGAHHV